MMEHALAFTHVIKKERADKFRQMHCKANNWTHTHTQKQTCQETNRELHRETNKG